jgi:para-nitrobenzyl esterase
MNYWTQFAKTGDPNQPGLPAWPAFAKGSESYLEIGRPIHADKDLNKAKLDLFESIPPARGTPPTAQR